MSKPEPTPVSGKPLSVPPDRVCARNYIAEMSAELSVLASAAGEMRLAEALDHVATLAREPD